jgi:signal transduction histidine kinase
MDLINFAAITLALVNLGLGVFVYARSFRRRINIFYSLVAASVSLWCFAVVVYRMTPDLATALLWCRILYLAPVFIVTSFLFFTLVFPSGSFSLNHFQKTLVLLPAALVSVLVMLPGVTIKHIFIPVDEEKVIVFGPGYALYFFFIITYFGWSFFKLGRNYFLSSGIQKMQIRYVFAGTFLSANLGMVTNLILPTLGIFSVNWLGQILSIIMVSFIAYAVIRHRLMDISLILKRTIIYSVLLVMTLSFYAALILLSQRFFQNTFGSTVSIVLGAFLMALGFEPLRRIFQRLTEQIFFKREYNPEEVLSRISQILSTIVDLKGILLSVNEILVQQLKLKNMATLVMDEAGQCLTPQAQVGELLPGNFEIRPDRVDPFSEYYFQQKRPHEILSYYDLRREMEEGPSVSRHLRIADHMERYSIILIVPIISKAKLIGLLLFGPKRSGDIYTTEDIRIFEIVSKQAATSIENAKLYEKLQQQMEELKQTQTQLIQSTKLAAIGELVANIAHEINNPLTNVVGYTSLVLEVTDEADPRHGDLKVIERETLRTRSIVRNLLEFSRQGQPTKEWAEVNEIVGDTLALIQNLADAANVRIVTQLGESLPKILIDVNQIKQVFINLMNNAIQAMANGGILTIQSFVQQEYLIVQFVDTGVGIPQEHLYKIFDPFFTTKPAVKGTGLGLSISYGIIKSHGGNILVESQIGKGSKFMVRFPLQPQEKVEVKGESHTSIRE